MTILTAICTSFKVEALQAIHDFSNPGGDTFKLALYTSSATLDETTTVYSATNEISAAGYSAGGIALTSVTPVASGTTAIVDFADAVFASTVIIANGALIYNSSKANRAVCTLSFGSDQSSTSAGFTVVFPPPTATAAILRFA